MYLKWARRYSRSVWLLFGRWGLAKDKTLDDAEDCRRGIDAGSSPGRTRQEEPVHGFPHVQMGATDMSRRSRSVGYPAVSAVPARSVSSHNARLTPACTRVRDVASRFPCGMAVSLGMSR